MSPTAPYQPHSETSKAAAEAKAPDSILTERARVLDAIRRYSRTMSQGLTDPEIQAILSIDGNTERPRRIELCTAGLVRKTSLKRSTKRSRLATVWEAV
jgi:hypothetical protein